MSEERVSSSCAGRARWVVWGSLALNLFLVGVLAGSFLNGPPPRPDLRGPLRGDFGPDAIFERFARDLEPSEAEKLRAIFEEGRSGLPEGRRDLHQRMQELAVILRAEKPDLDALRKVLGETKEAGEAMHARMSRAMERIATELSFESRQKIAQKMAEDRRRRPLPPPDGARGPEPEAFPPPTP